MEFVPFTNDLNRPKSGNPGYLSGAPLLISLGEDESGKWIVPADGFKASSSYLSGACLAAGEQSQSASSVNFLEDLLLSCSIDLGDEASLKSECESDSFSQLQIATQFEQWKQIGMFGNANISMQKDWRSVLATVVEEGGNTYDSERKMCKKLNVMEIEVLYSEIGFQANPQAYIVGVQRSIKSSEWYLGQGSYNYYASVSFRHVDKGNMRLEDLMDRIHSDLFYPIYLGNN